tara:strand:+ start:2161 stop:2778 length:618 start_codon:yes stop_codon:yes gene_type:complete
MNENDKILICSYLDGELNPEEQKYVEELIESSSEANNYVNAMKSSVNEIDAFFNSDKTIELTKRIDKFIENKKSKKTFNIHNFNIFNRNYLSGAVGFVLMGILIFPLIMEDEIENIIINTERAYLDPELNVNGSVDIEKILSNGFHEMNNNNINKANLIIGNEKILIIIENKKSPDCISGEFIYEDITRKFDSCLVNGKYVTEIN